MDARNPIDMLELRRRLDEVCGAVIPSEIVSGIQRAGLEHAEYVIGNYHPFVMQVEACFDLLVRVVDEINFANKDAWPPHRSLQCVLLANNLKPIYSSFDRIMKGFYEDSLALTRVSYEGFWRIVFLTLHPADPHWSFGRGRECTTQFQLGNLVRQTLGLDWPHYAVMSFMAHANQVSFLEEMVGIANNGQKEPLGLTLGFDENRFGMAVNMLQFVLLLYLKAGRELFLDDHGHPHDPEAIGLCDQCIDLMEQHFASHKNESFLGYVKDERDIFQMLKRVDAGEPFTQVWQGIRSPMG